MKTCINFNPLSSRYLIFGLNLLVFYNIYLNPIRTYTQSVPCEGVIVQYEGNNFNDVIKHLKSKRSSDLSWRKLGTFTKTYLITGEDCVYIFNECKNIRDIIAFEYNRKVANRNKPNDTKLNEQYYLNIIKAFEAWDVTTGGTDFTGREVVIGIIDDGYDLNHEDLIENIYTNPDELPGDNKDNDGNGYVDDVSGWNTRTNKGIHDEKSHGTYILGVLGASGNNGKGISGINWKIRLLPVTTGNLVSDVVEGYEYMLAERKQFNLSGGTKGSNILVSSYSGGISKEFAVNFPVWCAVYDKLGSEGILNISAATNEDDNIDIVGDMPSTCSSPYLMVVNSTNKADVKDAVTGYGAINVDISAPGEKILTTEVTSKGLYKTESGTSLSTPMIAGAAAILYSLDCESFYNLVKNDPTEAALVVKNVLIKSVDKKVSLEGKSVSEGRLNVFKAVKEIQAMFDNCLSLPSPIGALQINNVQLVGSTLKLEYNSPDESVLTFLVFDSAGKCVLNDKVTPPVLGDKILNIFWEAKIPGIYYASLISSKDAASKGFNVKLGN
ncbi:MAG: S8 family serine peptidase [Saprospiraceae bacterium]|nr:S8 family serine peptidase [Saprospiraceae bacterium]